MTLVFLSLLLFLTMDPMGNISPYQRLIKQVPLKNRKRVMIREILIALGVMLLFNEIGEILFHFLGLSEIGLRVASGVILFIIALKILFPPKDHFRNRDFPGEPYVFPLAVPLLAGPATLATIMLYAHLEPSRPMMFAAILIAWAACAVLLYFSATLQRILGNNGLAACERLMGMLLVLIAIQRIATAIQLFLTGKCCD